MKYIIEIEDEPFVRRSALYGEKSMYRAKGFKSLVFDQFGLDKLTPLDKALEKELEEAYQKGYDEAKLIYQNPNAESDYQRGLDDAWKCAKKIFGYEIDGGLPVDELRNAFGWESGPFCTADILRTNTASEVLAKIKAYEEQQKADAEIKVGDEVTPKSNDSNWLGVVVGVDDTNAMVMTRDGYTAMYRLEILKKTDKHYSQVEELLKAMKGGAE